MTSSITKTLFVGCVWVDTTQEITTRFASQHKAKVIAGAALYLESTRTPKDYQLFLMDRLQNWDGMRPLITTLDDCKVVLMPVLLYGEEITDLDVGDPAARD